MTDQTPDPGRVTFINNGGDTLGDASQDELDRVVRNFVADLLEHAGDRDYVLDLIAGVSLVDHLPATLLLRCTIGMLVADVLGPLQTTSPGMRLTLQVVATRYRK